MKNRVKRKMIKQQKLEIAITEEHNEIKIINGNIS